MRFLDRINTINGIREAGWREKADYVSPWESTNAWQIFSATSMGVWGILRLITKLRVKGAPRRQGWHCA